MELHSVHGMDLVLKPHDFPFLRPSGDFQTIRQGFAFYDQGVIASRLERTWHPGKDTLARMMDGRGLAMHQAVRPHDIAAINLADGLMAEADTEDGDGSAKFLDQPT